ncbi:MAG: hypothetical protein ABII64_08455 [Elusimicrobiota bacterium]
MRAIRFLIIGLAALVLFAAFNVLFASGLSTNFADVYIDNLKIGGSYNLSKVANYPMWVQQNGAAVSDIRIETTLPSRDDLRKGYEPIPDKSWITYSKTDFRILSGETQSIDVTVHVPDDKNLLGKKYMAHVFITGAPPKGGGGGVAIALGIKGKIYITVAKAPMSEKEMKEQKSKESAPKQGLIILPEKFYADNAAGGKTVKVTESVPLKLINPSRETLSIRIEYADPSSSGFGVPADFIQGGTGEISFSKTKFSLKPDGVENIDITVNLSRDSAKTKRFYVVRILVKSQTVELAKFVPVYITQ